MFHNSCGSLSSSLMNIQLIFPLDIPTKKFIVCAFIGHWSSGCHNTISKGHICYDLSSKVRTEDYSCIK